MPITIDGTGSITGLSAGGLPDLSVATADIAASAVTTAKIADANVTAAKLDGAQSGSAPIYAARAWVNFNGTGTVAIRASGNVSSITDNGTGDYTLSFATAMADTNYAFVSASRIDATTGALTANSICHPVTYSTGSVRVHTGRTSANQCDDHAFANFAIFR